MQCHSSNNLLTFRILHFLAKCRLIFRFSSSKKQLLWKHALLQQKWCIAQIKTYGFFWWGKGGDDVSRLGPNSSHTFCVLGGGGRGEAEEGFCESFSLRCNMTSIKWQHARTIERFHSEQFTKKHMTLSKNMTI